jgi:diaminohydroxyphosphoribosylaminopyrimidine deaminase/5-amino-6-(5-phosphoribosylamino)uracil reductase
VLDSRLRLPPDSRLARSARRAPVVVLCRTADPARLRALEDRGVGVLEVPGRGTRVALPAALRVMRRLGIWSVMVEGGGEVLGTFLREGLFDRVDLFRAPLLLGGRGSRAAFAGPDPLRIGDAVRLRPDPRSGGPGHEVWYPR